MLFALVNGITDEYGDTDRTELWPTGVLNDDERNGGGIGVQPEPEMRGPADPGNGGGGGGPADPGKGGGGGGPADPGKGGGGGIHEPGKGGGGGGGTGGPADPGKEGGGGAGGAEFPGNDDKDDPPKGGGGGGSGGGVAMVS